MKYLFVLALFAAVAAYAYWRLRPYIRGVRRIIGAVREVRRMQQGARQPDLSKKERKRVKKGAGRRGAPGEMLQRCAACGTWMPASRAVSLRGGATYCSHTCLERAADSPQQARKSAS